MIYLDEIKVILPLSLKYAYAIFLVLILAGIIEWEKLRSCSISAKLFNTSPTPHHNAQTVNRIMKFPYGLADFEKLISQGYYYADRTQYIHLFEIVLITLPNCRMVKTSSPVF